MIYCLKLIDMMMVNEVFAKNTMKLYCIFLYSVKMYKIFGLN